MPRLRGIDNRHLTLRAWLHERAGVLLRRLRVRADPIELPPPPFLQMTLRARSAGKAESVVRVDADYRFESYTEMRALYTDFLTGFLLPRTTVYSGDEVMIRTNSLGCRGEELELQRPVVAFFGDSTTLGVVGTADGVKGDTWTRYVDVDGYDVLNAGVEGLTIESVVRRYEALRDRVPLACAVVYTGWHNLIYNRRTPEHWDACLRAFLSPAHLTAFCTLPSPLLPEMRKRGIAPLLDERPEVEINGDYFTFWGEWDPSEWLPELLDAHERFNAHLLEFCRRTEAPLIDLRGFLYPATYETATEDFFDVCHPRPPKYPKIGAFMSGELRRILPATAPTIGAWRPPPAPDAPAVAEDVRRHIYPIW